MNESIRVAGKRVGSLDSVSVSLWREPRAGSETAAAQCKLGQSQVCSGGLGAA